MTFLRKLERLLWSAPAEHGTAVPCDDGALARTGQRGSGSAVPAGYSNPKRCRTRDRCPALGTAVQEMTLR